MIKKHPGELICPWIFPIDTSEGEQLRFPPSDARLSPLTALCLPFLGFALRPKGHTPLEPPFDLLRKSIKIRKVLDSLSLRGTMPVRLRMASSPDCLTYKEVAPEIGMLTSEHKLCGMIFNCNLLFFR